MRSATSNPFAKIFLLSAVSSLVSSCSNRFRTLNTLIKGHQKSAICYRFTLNKGELFRFPSECREVHVLSGVAWLTVGGEDIILTAERKASIPSNKDFALISALGDVPLILEVI